MIVRGEEGRGGGVVGKDVNSIINRPPFFSLLQLVRFFFLLKTSKKIKKETVKY